MKRILPAALFAFAAAWPAASQESPPLRIGWVQAMANAPALIAEEKGYFREEGLNVELKGFGDGPVIQQAVAGGEIDVAYIGAPPVYQWAARGLEAKIIAKVNYGQAALIARADGSIQSLSDLRGKKLAGVNRGSGMDVLLRGFVLKETAGLNPDADLQLSQMPVGNMNAALDTGVVDAAFSWEPFISQSVLRGTGRVVFDVNGALPGYPWYVVAAPSKTLKERPDDLVKLLRANAKAVAFLREHPEEANRIIAQSFKLEPVKAADGTIVPPEAIVAEARKRLGWSAEIEPSDRAFIQRLINYSVDLGILNKPLDVDDIVDDSFAAKAAAQR
ncbi:aliphatic sulfonate ABC transporter substrate-binding protein [Rhizobium leguminosarum bv. trifolii]|uniref:Aliphatic sulfonate ABC transporter substrate-binding protein n=1 Tax=Rhizobium leguminosarum bv. trifolii TaxID=386 RepID=A0A3E1B5Q1_RHILT|nr:ABC transporter substrate-binding protein [Rhizobium leguminosarum]RFB85178.1 aliphatic sulfonate ABC transporter substrate-binding protein [Rhizobium leguminosarum bv. trifolii]RFB86245.1 aliphatic sulfonate ABC transporter substrate-binding protein [Rhizobium leguminosarum bv. trifolii]